MSKRTIASNKESFSINLRLPASIKSTIEEMALKDYRSINQEVVFILMNSIQDYLSKKKPEENKDISSK